MLTKRERDIVAAAAEALCPPFPSLSPEARAQVLGDVAGFLARQIASMPVLLRTPYRAALIAFDAAALLRGGHTFRRLGADGRSAHLAWWADLGGLATGNFVKLLRSCALLAYFDHPLVAACLTSGARAGEAA